MSAICMVKNCESKTQNQRFHKFPEQRIFALKWCEAIGRQDLKLIRMTKLMEKAICSNHFTKGDYTCRDGEVVLLATAVPHIIANARVTEQMDTKNNGTKLKKATLITENGTTSNQVDEVSESLLQNYIKVEVTADGTKWAIEFDENRYEMSNDTKNGRIKSNKK